MNSRLIAAYVIQNSSSDRFREGVDRKRIVDLQNRAWEMDSGLYRYIQHGFSILDYLDSSTMSEKTKQLNEYLNFVTNTVEMQKVLDEVEKALNLVRNEWNQNLEQSNIAIADILGFELEGNWNVYIQHSAIKTGANLSGDILWAHRTDWKNYNTIYLWHEILHSTFGHSNEEHAIIELIADNELRARLNKITYPPFEGHDFLGDFREHLLPDWQKYLKSTPRDIKKFVADHSVTK